MVQSPWRRIQTLALISGAVPSVIALVLIWVAPGIVEDSPAMRWTLTGVVLATWLLCWIAARDRTVERLRTFSNILSAIREQDYTVRATGTGGASPLSEIATELNALAEHMRFGRLASKDSDALLAKVLEEIDTAIFAFDEEHRLQLVNRKGAQWLARPVEGLLGVSSRVLGLDACLQGEAPRVVEMAFPGDTGRYEIRRTVFRQGGRPLTLLALTDLSRALAAEERSAWKRLIQVLRHEINNSLAPIRSLAATLSSKAAREPKPADWERDLREGLDVIESRSESLVRLTSAYSKLTRLPAPTFDEVPLRPCLERVAALEIRVPVHLEPGPEVTVRADVDQLEQALINLTRNAADASLETGGAVRLGWSLNHVTKSESVLIEIQDDGPGFSDSENLFVPFYTTKSGGTGIGLVLSRQIILAHGGDLVLGARNDRPGGRATIRLPLA